VPLIAVTRVEQVRQAILMQILSGSLRPGERLLEAKLSKELGVSQATVKPRYRNSTIRPLSPSS